VQKLGKKKSTKSSLGMKVGFLNMALSQSSRHAMEISRLTLPQETTGAKIKSQDNFDLFL
jgi:hypothetical protein